MKNNILYIAMSLLVTFALASCDDDSTEGQTWITYYPAIELEGDETMYVDKGSDYEEPGYTATYNGEDVSDQVTISGSVDTSASGIYYITYSVSADGSTASASRTVVVLDPDDPIEGLYDTDESCYRLYSGSYVYYGGYEILILNYGDYYYVDDLLGGYYRDYCGYGDSYAMEGGIIANDDNTIELYYSYVSGWGDSAEFMSDGVFDPETGTMSWMIEYTTYPMDFYVTMYKRTIE